MNRTVALVAASLVAACSHTVVREDVKPLLTRVDVVGIGLSTPESVLVDSKNDIYLVSNINGSPLEADDNGFISKLRPDGAVIALKWIDGASPDVLLSAPKGMAVVGDTLYVSDITSVRKFEMATGKQLDSVDIPGATFLNDVVADEQGQVYVTDSGLKAGTGDLVGSGSDAIWRLDSSGPVKVASGPSLNNPNGIAAAGGRLTVVTFGAGRGYELRGSGVEDVLKLEKGSLDGVVVLPNGDLLVSSWESQSIWRVKPGGASSEVATGLKAPADIGYDSRRQAILVPLFMDNALAFVPLGS